MNLDRKEALDPNKVASDPTYLFRFEQAWSDWWSFSSNIRVYREGKHRVQEPLTKSFFQKIGFYMQLQECQQVLKLLKESKENTGVVYISSRYYCGTLLHMATRYQMHNVLSWLLANTEGININAVDSDAMTACHIAISQNDLRSLKLLQESGQRLGYDTVSGKVRALKQHPSFTATKSSTQVMRKSLSSVSLKVLKFLLEQELVPSSLLTCPSQKRKIGFIETIDKSMLHEVLTRGNGEVAAFLIELKADMNDSCNKITPLLLSCRSDKTLHVTKMLIEAAPDIEQEIQSGVGRTNPLHEAMKRSPETVRYFLNEYQDLKLTQDQLFEGIVYDNAAAVEYFLTRIQGYVAPGTELEDSIEVDDSDQTAVDYTEELGQVPAHLCPDIDLSNLLAVASEHNSRAVIKVLRRYKLPWGDAILKTKEARNSQFLTWLVEEMGAPIDSFRPGTHTSTLMQVLMTQTVHPLLEFVSTVARLGATFSQRELGSKPEEFQEAVERGHRQYAIKVLLTAEGVLDYMPRVMWDEVVQYL